VPTAPHTRARFAGQGSSFALLNVFQVGGIKSESGSFKFQTFSNDMDYRLTLLGFLLIFTSSNTTTTTTKIKFEP